MTTRPQLEQAVMLTNELASVDVRWSSFDATDTERSSEHSHYILWRGDDGQLCIRVALHQARLMRANRSVANHVRCRLHRSRF